MTKTDTQLKQDIENELRWNPKVNALTGVVSVYNSTSIKPEATAEQVKENVQAALQRHAATDAKSIHVETSGGRVTLTGTATSWQSIDDASRAAWAVPGVTQVVDKLTVSI